MSCELQIESRVSVCVEGSKTSLQCTFKQEIMAAQALLHAIHLSPIYHFILNGKEKVKKLTVYGKHISNNSCPLIAKFNYRRL